MLWEKRVTKIDKETEEEQRKLDPYAEHKKLKLQEEIDNLNISSREKEQRKQLMEKYNLHLDAPSNN